MYRFYVSSRGLTFSLCVGEGPEHQFRRTSVADPERFDPDMDSNFHADGGDLDPKLFS